MQKTIYTLLLSALFSVATAQTKPASKKAKPAAAASAAPAQTQPNTEALLNAADKYAETIIPDDLSRHLHVIAGETTEGRGTGQVGQEVAAEFLISQFSRLGLQGPVENSKNPFLQSFELIQSGWQDGYVQTSDKTFTLFNDFYIMGDPAYKFEQNEQLVFAGYGIQESGYSDYAGLDVTGKAVVILAGEPDFKKKQQNKGINWQTNWKEKVRIATEFGASNVFIISGSDQKAFKETLGRVKHSLQKPRLQFMPEEESNLAAAFFISPDMGAALLDSKAKKIAKYKKAVNKKQAPQNYKLKALPVVKVKAAQEVNSIIASNVLAYLEGSDLKEEVIVLTAHYDHLGNQHGEVYYGADDDGSGTVSLIEIAEAFSKAKKDGFGPRRSILFMAVTAEEHGLLGSEYYTKNPVFPIEKTVANLNIDMIGRVDDKHPDTKEYVYIIGSDKLSSQLHEINEHVNKTYTDLKLDYTYNREDDPNRFYYRSDHYNFARLNVPVIFYFSGVHEDYHKPTDTVDKIMFEKMTKIVKLIFHTTWNLANRDERIVVDKAQ